MVTTIGYTQQGLDLVRAEIRNRRIDRGPDFHVNIVKTVLVDFLCTFCVYL